MHLEPLHLLALAGTPILLLAGVLAGVWIGFRVVTRDAALLARFAVEAREARALADAVATNVKTIREEVDATLETAERKRSQAAASLSRATAAAAAAQQPPNGHAEPQAELSLRERRRLVARRALRGA